ncbi:MAG: hypothetical protein V4723_15265 [Pseudomonadota bacterium]
MRALPVLGMLMLAGCGGGESAPAPMPPVQSPGIQIGEPTPGLFDTSSHLRQAANAECADRTNKLYVIDNKYVFWDRAGNCPDNSYSHSLMGSDAAAPLCTASDSIAGPVVRCTDDSVRPMFDTIRANLGKADLGLGPTHAVKALEVPGKAGSALAFETLVKAAFSGVAEPKNVVITSADDLARVWAEHTATMSPRPELPRVDFNTHMVLALFAGNSKGCQEFEVNRVANGADGIVVDYIHRDINAQTICIAAITNPVHIIAVPLSKQSVRFQRMDAEFLPFATLYSTGYAMPLGAPDANLVIKDAATFDLEWERRRNADSGKPAVDFGRQMVIAVFGTGTDGCQGMGIKNIYRSAGTVYVNIVRSRPAPDGLIACTQALTFPAHWVAIDKTDAPVIFLTQTRYYR